MNHKSLMPMGRDRGVPASPFLFLQREVDRLFDDFTRGIPAAVGEAAQLMPSVDVAETDKEIQITAELPGLEEKDVQINVSDNLLTIRGEKKAEREEADEKNKSYRVVECSYGMFERTIQLPEGVNPDSINATMSKGVLKIAIPKPQPAKAKRIEVKSAA